MAVLLLLLLLMLTKLQITTHLPSAKAAMTCGTCGCMHIDTTGLSHARAASGGGGRAEERCSAEEVE
jgi:hypothetical protein